MVLIEPHHNLLSVSMLLPGRVPGTMGALCLVFWLFFCAVRFGFGHVDCCIDEGSM